MNHPNMKANSKHNPLVIVLGVLSTVICSGIYRILPQFKQTFEGFGTDLPFLSFLFSEYHVAFLGLAILTASLCVAAVLTTAKVLRRASIIASAVGILLLPLTTFVLYLPVLEMSQP